MTIYSVRINKHKVVKTTALHEAINLAKKTLEEKILARGFRPTSVSEKIYLDGENKATYRVFATILERYPNGSCQRKTLSASVKMENISEGSYNFDLNNQLCCIMR